MTKLKLLVHGSLHGWSLWEQQTHFKIYLFIALLLSRLIVQQGVVVCPCCASFKRLRQKICWKPLFHCCLTYGVAYPRRVRNIFFFKYIYKSTGASVETRDPQSWCVPVGITASYSEQQWWVMESKGSGCGQGPVIIWLSLTMNQEGLCVL